MQGRGLGVSLPTTTVCSIKTIGQLLRQSKYTIMLVLDPILTYEEVEIFMERVCTQCAPKPRRVLDLLRETDTNISEQETDGSSKNSDRSYKERRQRLYDNNCISFGNRMRQLPTSLPSLDQILGGGVRLATVTELVGRSGVGKTQLAFQLCITAAKFNQGAIYIDTEKKLSLERLREMSEQRYVIEMQQQSYVSNLANNEYSGQRGKEDAITTFKPGGIVLDNLTLHQPGSSQELLDVLDELEYEILIRNQTATSAISKPGSSDGADKTEGNRTVQGKYPVRLLIVDSIAAPIRRDFGSGSAPQRASIVFQCAQKLKRLADQLHMAVVVINQVGSSEGGGGTSNTFDGTGSRGFGASVAGSGSEYQQHMPVRAALGTSWHHCVSTRLLLETQTVDTALEARTHSFDNDHSNGESSFRQSTQPSSRVMRKVTVTKSNRTQYGAETHFNITTMGIVEV